jgi:hypothetical protein
LGLPIIAICFVRFISLTTNGLVGSSKTSARLLGHIGAWTALALGFAELSISSPTMAFLITASSGAILIASALIIGFVVGSGINVWRNRAGSGKAIGIAQR